jgi:hypothetical protein
MLRNAIVSVCALLLAAPVSFASAPAPGVEDAHAAAWKKVDAEVAALPDVEAKAGRILEHAEKSLYAEDVFSRLIHLPCQTTRDFYVSVLTNAEHSYHWNAHLRRLAATGLGEVGEAKHAAVLKKVAAEDPTTDERAGSAPVMKGHARVAARRALERLAERFPGKKAGWMK